jgi:hypothetical protein
MCADLTESGDFQNGASYSANLFWSPVETATFGIEYVYAEREIASGQFGSASRLNALARFDF